LGRKLFTVALAWQIYQRTHNPLALGIIGLAEAIPFIGTSLWIGHLVDRHPKKPFMLGAEGGMALCAVVMCVLAPRPGVPLGALYALIACTGAFISFGTVAGSSFAQTVIPREDFPRAMAWNLGTFTAATVAGPLLGGWVMAWGSARAVYALAVTSFALSLLFLSGMGAHPSPPTDDAPAWTRVREGLRFVRGQPLILACMSLDMVAMLFGDAVALYPIFADRFGAGPVGFGILRASPALGAGLLSLMQGLRPFVNPSWRNLKRVVFAFGLCMIAFALSPHIAAASLFLILGGAVDGISVIIRQSIYQARTPDHLRGRVASLSGIFISASNEIGAFESGVAARWLGPVGSVLFGATVTLTSALGFDRLFRAKIREG
jgi:predicted MFS family arabinose efflux permease